MRFFRTYFFIIAFLFLGLVPGVVRAEGISEHEPLHVSRLCNNLSCTGYSRINWFPSAGLSSSALRVDVSDTGVTGLIWSEKLGWIKLNPTTVVAPVDPACADVGVKMVPEGSGTLVGCAWGQGTGWINFSTTEGGSVQINSSGEFSGWAWVQNTGWMRFDCALDNACVQTSWGIVAPPPLTTTSGGTGHGTPGTTTTTTGTTGTTTTGTTGGGTTGGVGTTGGHGTTSGTSGGGTTGRLPDPDPIKEIIRGGTKIKKIIDSETIKNIIRTIGIIGLVGSAAVTVTSGLFLSSFTNFAAIPTHLWSLLLGAVGLAKRRRPWGTVYDSVTKQPLDPAYVILRSIEGKDVATAITDLDGRYGFVVPTPGAYTLVAHKTNYAFPSQKLVGYDHDELYRDLYFGETFNIASAGEVITRNIPMDPLHFDWNEFAKKQKHLLRFYSSRETWLLRLSELFFYVGFFVVAFTVLFSMTKYNIIVFCLYSVLFFIRKVGLQTRPFGKITSSVSGDPIPFAIIRITQKTTGVEIMQRVADMLGRYYALLPNGEYLIRVDEKLPDASYRTVVAAYPVTVTKGYLSEKIAVNTGSQNRIDDLPPLPPAGTAPLPTTGGSPTPTPPPQPAATPWSPGTEAPGIKVYPAAASATPAASEPTPAIPTPQKDIPGIKVYAPTPSGDAAIPPTPKA